MRCFKIFIIKTVYATSVSEEQGDKATGKGEDCIGIIHWSSSRFCPFKCFQCCQCVYAKSELRILTTHINGIYNKEKSIHCNECSCYATHQSSNLRGYVKVKHNKVKSFECIQCNYFTYNNCNLKRHVIEVKAFRCIQLKKEYGKITNKLPIIGITDVEKRNNICFSLWLLMEGRMEKWELVGITRYFTFLRCLEINISIFHHINK